MKNLQSNIKVKDGQVDTCQKLKSDLNVDIERLNGQIKEAEESMGTIKRENVRRFLLCCHYLI